MFILIYIIKESENFLFAICFFTGVSRIDVKYKKSFFNSFMQIIFTLNRVQYDDE